MKNILEINNLSVSFQTPRGVVNAVQDLSLTIKPSETLGIVGESGSGKSVSSLAMMGLLPPNATVKAEKLNFLDYDLQKISERQKQDIRGRDIAMIFQDPMTSLNPSFTVGYQIMETLKIHQRELSKKDRHDKSVELLKSVGIASPETSLNSYPHQLSGGMSQRMMIAMALACKPKLLIADEPTTALDVTIQSQILQLLDKISHEEHMSMILITHNIAIVAEYSDRMLVMYAGQGVEEGPTEDVIARPRHPYTKALLDSLPGHHTHIKHREHLFSIRGMVPDLIHRPTGCQLHPRCSYVHDDCKTSMPMLEPRMDRNVRCFYPLSDPNSKESSS